MPRLARKTCVDPADVQVLHTVQRCVRRAFLCGEDDVSGKSFEHRRLWIRQRLEFLASIFGIDCLTYTVLHNHLHLILRSRADVVATWSDEAVARRWLRLFPRRRNKDGSPATPTQPEIDIIVNQPALLVEKRRRLSDVSWWMKCTCENIARRANAEDECTGHFWEGRYKCQVLLDEASLLACAAYVDLNPIRAAIAQSPETSEFTGVKDRLDDFAERSSETAEAEVDAEVDATTKAAATPKKKTHAWERSRRRKASGWLSPIEIDETLDVVGADGCEHGRRCSQKGFLRCTLSLYLELLDWTGRQIREGKRGAIPAHLNPNLTRIGLDAPGWCDLVAKFGKVFKRAAGTAESLAEEARRRGVGWIQAPGNPLSTSG